MALISLIEIWRLIIVSLVLGYIFSGLFTTRVKTVYDYLNPRKFRLNDILLSIGIAAPAVILHELAHKFVALAFGLNAEFFLSYFGLALGVILKLVGSPLIIFAPGYVGISGNVTPTISAVTASAGPALNLILWLGSDYLIKNKHNLKRKQTNILGLTSMINKWLFIFNMIPIPPLDGSKVFYGLFQAIF